MRVVSTHVSGGTVYRIYRSDEQFVADMKRLIPFLSECGGDVSIGGTEDDPNVVLIVGPLDGAVDEAFLDRVRSHMA